jgi:hypothetical protein
MRTETQGLFCALNAIVAYLQVLPPVSVVHVGIRAAEAIKALLLMHLAWTLGCK